MLFFLVYARSNLVSKEMVVKYYNTNSGWSDSIALEMAKRNKLLATALRPREALICCRMFLARRLPFYTARLY